MCHFQVSAHCCWVPFCHRDAGRLQASHSCCCQVPLICCCQAPSGPLYRLLMLLQGPQCVMPYYVPHIAAARPLICHGPLYRLLTLLPGPQCVMGPCTGLPLLLSPTPHSANMPLSGLLTLL
ncbi:unnamed protein product, partial [Staurois parvus]